MSTDTRTDASTAHVADLAAELLTDDGRDRAITRELARLRAVADPGQRLDACKNLIDAIGGHAQALRDERDSLIYAGSDRYSQPGADPTGWRGVGHWRQKIIDIGGIGNNLLHRIESRRVFNAEDPTGFWRTWGPKRIQTKRLPDATAAEDQDAHWTVVHDLNKTADNLDKLSDALAGEIRIPALLELMVADPSNTALADRAGLTIWRLEQIRRHGRATGVLPPVAHAAAG